MLKLSVFVFVMLTSLSSQVSATLILEKYDSGVATPDTIGSYSMTDFDITNSYLVGSATEIGSTTSSIDSPFSGTLSFKDRNSNLVGLTRDRADNANWWNNGENTDYDIFTTNLNLITILLPENTRAFSFNVGADLGSTGNNAWLTATEFNGSGIGKLKFNVNRNNTPGFGIYTDNSDGSCSTLTSVTIDPLLWGFGNFSINQDSCSVSVPSPTPFALMLVGLIGLGISRKVNKL